MSKAKRSASAAGARGGVLRGVEYASSPLLASKTPPGRSKFLVGFVGAAFCVLLGRAVYVHRHEVLVQRRKPLTRVSA